MTRKLPADIPSPEERGAVRPDEPETGEILTVTPGGNRTTIGLLGCDVTDLAEDGSFAALASMNGRRIEEIERRILAMEQMIWPLGR